MLTSFVLSSIIVAIMKSCAFFGHRDYNYEPMREQIGRIISELIEREGVTEFFSGFRGNFDALCSETAHALKVRYPHIKVTMVLSYHPQKNFVLPSFFDGSIYLLERAVPPVYAILETNKRLVERVDLILSGVEYSFGGAAKALEYAKKLKKTIVVIEK